MQVIDMDKIFDLFNDMFAALTAIITGFINPNSGFLGPVLDMFNAIFTNADFIELVFICLVLIPTYMLVKPRRNNNTKGFL